MQIANKSNASGRLSLMFSRRLVIARPSQKSGMKKPTTTAKINQKMVLLPTSSATANPKKAGTANLAPRKMSACAGFLYPASINRRVSPGSGSEETSLRMTLNGLAISSALRTERQDWTSPSSLEPRASLATLSRSALCAEERGSINRNKNTNPKNEQKPSKSMVVSFISQILMSMIL